LLNPKVGLFFLVVAPQYAPSLSVASILALGVIDAVVALVYLTALAVTANLIFERITDCRAQRRLRLYSGAAIALVGVYVFVDAVR
jgi:threonine/homoserine/homoserine lactone efflux protein